MRRLALVGHDHGRGRASQLISQVILAIHTHLEALALATLGGSCTAAATTATTTAMMLYAFH
jgi:hypothetical protein